MAGENTTGGEERTTPNESKGRSSRQARSGSQTKASSRASVGTQSRSGSSSRARSRSRKNATPPAPLFSKAGALQLWERASRSLEKSTRTLRKRTDRIKRDVKKSIRKSPFEIVAATAGAGLFFGALLGSFIAYKRAGIPHDAEL